MSIAIADVLDRAADLIEPEGRWTQGEAARDAEGLGLVAPHPLAVCWCAYGAIAQVADIETVGFASRALDENRTWDAIAFNDAPGRTQAEVVAKLREAAAAQRAAS